MRRMYGEERHIAVLRAELMTNDVEQMQNRYVLRCFMAILYMFIAVGQSEASRAGPQYE